MHGIFLLIAAGNQPLNVVIFIAGRQTFNDFFSNAILIHCDLTDALCTRNVRVNSRLHKLLYLQSESIHLILVFAVDSIFQNFLFGFDILLQSAFYARM